jgi:Holliday junction resolvase
MKPKHAPSRTGDMAEHYAITWLWDQGYEVFKNCGCTGAIDLVAIKDGKTILIDVKTMHKKEPNRPNHYSTKGRTQVQKDNGVVHLGYHPIKRKLRFIKHKE